MRAKPIQLRKELEEDGLKVKVTTEASDSVKKETSFHNHQKIKK